MVRSEEVEANSVGASFRFQEAGEVAVVVKIYFTSVIVDDNIEMDSALIE